MDEIKKILTAADKTVAKGISMSTLDGGSGSNTLSSRQNLDPIIPSIANRNTPFYDMVRKVDGSGAGITFNLRVSLFTTGDNKNPRDAVYADGGLPKQTTSQYKTLIKAYRAVGTDGKVTGLATAVGASVLNLYAQEVEAKTRAHVQDIEWLSIWGSETTLNTNGLPQFPGLNEYITTNVIDAAGGAITKQLIDKAAGRIRMQGGSANLILCSFGVEAAINAIYTGTERVIVNEGGRDNITWGNVVPRVSTTAGIMSVVGDFFINPGNTYPLYNGASSSPVGASVSTVFIVNTDYVSLNFLQRPTFEELGRVADYQEFFIKSYLTMELTAEPWFAKIINVQDTYIA
jgi:Family of unknown function (DUF5309)